jgi:hypothetical protein
MGDYNQMGYITAIIVIIYFCIYLTIFLIKLIIQLINFIKPFCCKGEE